MGPSAAFSFPGRKTAGLVLALWTVVLLTCATTAGALFFVGYCNFNWLQIVGWCAWLGVAAMILRAAPCGRPASFLSVPAVFSLMQPQEAANFLIALSDCGPLVLHIDVRRSTLREIARRRSFFRDRFEAILPEPRSEAGLHALYGLVRNASGRLMVLWRTGVVPP